MTEYFLAEFFFQNFFFPEFFFPRFFFFFFFCLQNRGAPYTQVRLIHGDLRYVKFRYYMYKCKKKKKKKKKNWHEVIIVCIFCIIPYIYMFFVILLLYKLEKCRNKIKSKSNQWIILPSLVFKIKCNMFLFNFKYANSHIRNILFHKYCSSFYGSQLYPLFSAILGYCNRVVAKKSKKSKKSKKFKKNQKKHGVRIFEYSLVSLGVYSGTSLHCCAQL